MPATRLLPRRERFSVSLVMSLIAKTTGIARRIAIRPYFEKNSRTACPGAALRVAGTLAASMFSWTLPQMPASGAGSCLPAPGRQSVSSRSGLRLDRLVECQGAVLDAVDAVVRQRGVTVLVDRVGPQHALAVLGVEQRLDDVLLVPGARALDRVQRETRRLVAVDGVRVGVLLAVLLGELLEELLPLRRVLVRRQRRDGHLDLRRHVGGDAALLGIGEPGFRDTVRPVELRVGQRRREVLVELDRVVGGDARVDEAVRARALRLLSQ